MRSDTANLTAYRIFLVTENYYAMAYLLSVYLKINGNIYQIAVIGKYLCSD